MAAPFALGYGKKWMWAARRTARLLGQQVVAPGLTVAHQCCKCAGPLPSHLLLARCSLASAAAAGRPAAPSGALSGAAEQQHREQQQPQQHQQQYEAAEQPAVLVAKPAASPGLYWKLAKGKLTLWVTLSALPGYMLAVPGVIDPTTLAALAVGTMLTSSSAQAMNQIMEVDRDSVMSRTAQRPLPAGRMTLTEATAFACASGGAGLALLTVGATPAASALAGVTMATYVGLYTPLKVLSPYNTHVGAISGSLPTAIGFAAALGSGVLASPWAGHAVWLFAMQTLWQMPHFYSLAWLYRGDYLKGGYKMFPLSDATGLATAKMSKPYLVAMCAMPWLASGLGLASWMLPVGAALPSGLWWRALRKFEEKPSQATCKRFFLGSLSYLLAVLALFTAFGRASLPDAAAGSTSSTQEESAHGGSANQESLEPRWRASLKEKLSQYCPHELIGMDFLGVLRAECPFGRRQQRA